MKVGRAALGETLIGTGRIGTNAATATTAATRRVRCGRGRANTPSTTATINNATIGMSNSAARPGSAESKNGSRPTAAQGNGIALCQAPICRRGPNAVTAMATAVTVRATTSGRRCSPSPRRRVSRPGPRLSTRQ